MATSGSLPFEVLQPGAAEYTLLAREAHSLALLGEIPEYSQLTYTRRMLEAGEFGLDIARGVIDPDLIAVGRLIEIRRDGAFEFAGIITHATYDAIDESWRLSGSCLLWLLAGRVVVPASGQEFDAVSGVVAETAMRGYVTRHLFGAGRDIRDELDGVTFTFDGSDLGRGQAVEWSGRYTSLLAALVEMGTAGNLLHAVEFAEDYAGYLYRLWEPVDATWSSGSVPVILATEWQTVATLSYERNEAALVNVVYALGQGAGASRAVEIVTDAGSIAAGWRRERSVDSRNSGTAGGVQADGQAVIDKALAAATRIDAQPLPVGTAQYRYDWDLGWDVTIAIPEIGVTLERRIVAVTVTLGRQGEEVKIALGDEAPTIARVIDRELRRALPSQLV